MTFGRPTTVASNNSRRRSIDQQQQQAAATATTAAAASISTSSARKSRSSSGGSSTTTSAGAAAGGGGASEKQQQHTGSGAGGGRRSSFTRGSFTQQQPRGSFTAQQPRGSFSQQQQRNSICSRVSSLTRDSSTRSLDPLKIELTDLTRIFGRTEEQDILQTTFVRVLKRDSQQKEIVLIRGKPGTGKTALVLDLKDAITSTSTGYFCSSKFRQYQKTGSHHTPYTAISSALNEVCDAIASGSDRDSRRTALIETMGLERLNELTKLLPKLNKLLSSSSSSVQPGNQHHQHGGHHHQHQATNTSAAVAAAAAAASGTRSNYTASDDEELDDDHIAAAAAVKAATAAAEAANNNITPTSTVDTPTKQQHRSSWLMKRKKATKQQQEPTSSSVAPSSYCSSTPPSQQQKQHNQQSSSNNQQQPNVDPWKDNLHHLHTYLKQLIQILCQPSKPIVMFLDNLQWADTASLNFISNLTMKLETNHFMFIGAYRDDVIQLLPWMITNSTTSTSKTATASTTTTSLSSSSPSDPLEPTTITQSSSSSASASQFNNNNRRQQLNQQNMLTEIEIGNLSLQYVDDLIADLTGGSPSSGQHNQNNNTGVSGGAGGNGNHTHQNNNNNNNNDNDSGNNKVSELAKIVFEKSHGNPYTIFQFLEMLQRKELLLFCFQAHKWVWDLDEIRRKTEVTQNVGIALVSNIKRLSKEGLSIMTLAAVIGLSFNPNILEQIAMHMELLENEFREHVATAMQGIIQDAVSGGLIHPEQMQEIMATQLEAFIGDDGDGSGTDSSSLKKSFYEETVLAAVQEAEVEGLVIKTPSKAEYKFSHELVHQALYDRIPHGDEREGLHMRIGKIMKAFYYSSSRSSSHRHRQQQDELFFAAVEHLNIGSAHLETQKERIDLIEMNQRACHKAKSKSALFSAADYSKKSVELLKVDDGGTHDWTNHYELMLRVYNDAAELCYACGKFDTSLELCEEILQNGNSLQDKLRALYVRVEVLHSQQKSTDAIDSCLSVLRSLGVTTLDKHPHWRHLFMELRRVKKLVKSCGEEGLLSIPSMTDPTKVESMKFLSLLATMTYFRSDSLLLPMVILRMMKSSIKDGFCDFTPFSLAGYGMLLSSVGGTSEEAFNYGTMSLTLCSRLSNDICIPGTHLIVFTHLDHLRNPLLNGVEPLLRGYQAGIGNGELKFAATCMSASAAIGFICALPLKAYAQDLKHVCEQLKLLKQDTIWTLVAPYRQSALNLVGEIADDDEGLPEPYQGNSEKKFLTEIGIAPREQGLPWHNFFMLSYIVAYIFNDVDLAHETRKEMRERKNVGPKGMHFIVYLEAFFSGLVDFARYRKTKKRNAMRKGKRSIRAMEKFVKDGIVNCHGMLLCLQAEHETIGGKSDVVKKLFDDAITVFASGGFLHFQAIANERAAEYFLSIGNRIWAEAYMGAAIRLYTEWGAAAKAQQLVEENKIKRKTPDDAPHVITVRGGQQSNMRFPRIQGHIEEEFMSSDYLI